MLLVCRDSEVSESSKELTTANGTTIRSLIYTQSISYATTMFLLLKFKTKQQKVPCTVLKRAVWVNE